MQTLKFVIQMRIFAAGKRTLPGALLLIPCLCLPPLATAQAPAFADGWQRVESLPNHATVHVKSDSGAATCLLDRVDDAGLTCSSRDLHREFSRSQIKEIKTSRRGRSAAKDAAIGLGVGAGVGFVAFAALNGSDTGSMVHTSTSKASGAGAAVGGAGGVLVGAIVGCSRGFSSGTVVYRQP